MKAKKTYNIQLSLFTWIIEMFYGSWTIMLVMGALLGNAGLWTPAYWEIFGGLYIFSSIVSMASRSNYRTVQQCISMDVEKKKNRKQELI